MEQRAGILAGATVYALSNHTLLNANESAKGVTAIGKPSRPHKSARCWSVMMITTLGLGVCADIGMIFIIPETAEIENKTFLFIT
ncbi:unknown [Bacteroides ovatus CAG:22]|nr:unknown [Bacteroides ovatus CAG:22]